MSEVCDEPDSIANGDFSKTGSRPQVSLQVTYTCSDDYSLVEGDPTRTCSDQRDGWSGNTPTCESKSSWYFFLGLGYLIL